MTDVQLSTNSVLKILPLCFAGCICQVVTIQWLKEMPSVPFCSSWSLLLYDMLLMEMFDYELALTFNLDLLLTQEVCNLFRILK